MAENYKEVKKIIIFFFVKMLVQIFIIQFKFEVIKCFIMYA